MRQIKLPEADIDAMFTAVAHRDLQGVLSMASARVEGLEPLDGYAYTLDSEPNSDFILTELVDGVATMTQVHAYEYEGEFVPQEGFVDDLGIASWTSEQGDGYYPIIWRFEPVLVEGL